VSPDVDYDGKSFPMDLTSFSPSLFPQSPITLLLVEGSGMLGMARWRNVGKEAVECIRQLMNVTVPVPTLSWPTTLQRLRPRSSPQPECGSWD